MRKKLLYIVTSIFLCLLVCFNISAEAIVFSDVDKSTTGGQAVYKMVEYGYVKGMPDGTFKPTDSLTRAQLVKLVNQVFCYEEKGENIFSDIKEDQWFYNDILIAQKAGYIKGMGDGTFHPYDKITREQMCVILNGILNFNNLPIDKQISDPVSSWAKDSVNKLVSNRVFLLDQQNRFRARQAISREAGCIVLSKFIISIPDDSSSQDWNNDITKEELIRRMSRVVNSLETKVAPQASTDKIRTIAQLVSSNMKAYIEDNNYNYKSEATKTYQLYQKLSDKEKVEFKRLVEENNWTDDLIILYDFFFEK